MRLFGLEIRRAGDPNAPETAPQVRQRLHRLEIALSELEEHHSALAAAHAKLRNQFHGQKGGRPVAEPAQDNPLASIPVGDKAALRLAVGIRPVNRGA